MKENDRDRSALAQISLGIVCPMANEEVTARQFVIEVLEQCKKNFKSVTFFAVLDNVSQDRTRTILDDLKNLQPELRVVWAPENRCVVDAYVAGYREALRADCDWILEMDAGFSHQPAEMPQFFYKMLEGYDCVFGSRFCDGGSIQETSLKRYLLSRGGTLLSKLVLGSPLKDMTSGFELFTRHTLHDVLDRGIRSRGPFFQTEIKAYCRRLKIAEVPIHYRGANHKIGAASLQDSLANLWRLFQLRLHRKL